MNRGNKVFMDALEDILRKVDDVGEPVVRMRHIRESKGYSLEDLGRVMGYSGSYIHRVEKGRHSPNIKFLISMAKGFRVHLCDFLITLGYTPPIKNEEKVDSALTAILGDLPRHDQIKLARSLRTIRDVFAEG